jgi:hypothetical protein
LVVTSDKDIKTIQLVNELGYDCYTTDAFYRRGALFNKGAAMEEGFDVLGREGWICIWDCDIVMPSDIRIPMMEQDCLYGPNRRILENPIDFQDGLDWSKYPCPTHPNEFAGYFQLFHASTLPQRPWYSTDWTHAGGCDSDFQSKFPQSKCRRTSFDVLHLGPEGMPEHGSRVGRNWCGRVIPRLDNNELPPNAIPNHHNVCKMIKRRRLYGTRSEKLK